MTTIADFKAISKDVRERVDVLVQFSEIFYLMCGVRRERLLLPGGQTFDLLRRAVGFELAARLYRLLEATGDKEKYHFGALTKMLADDRLLSDLFAAANTGGRKSKPKFAQTRDTALSMLTALRNSPAYQRVEVFRHKYVGHRLPSPGMLSKVPASANVDNLKVKDLRFLISRVGRMYEHIARLEGCKGFRWKATSELAQSDAKQFFATRNPLSFLDS